QGGRYPLAAAARRDAADVRPEARRARRAEEAAGEDGAVRRGDAGADRGAELAEEDEVDVAAAELGIEPADDEAARARELELDRRAGRGEHPRPGDRHADVEA